MKQIKEQYDQKDVLILSYHVDYWDKLGWKDRFSSAENTERQKYYADIFHLESIYTPEVVVNGQKEFVGSDKARLLQSISTGKENRSFDVIPEKKNNKISVSVSNANLKRDEEMVIALVQSEASTQVGSGENGGKQLHHVNIVREYKILGSKNTSAEFSLGETEKSQFFIAAFIQNKTGSIISFNTAPVN